MTRLAMICLCSAVLMGCGGESSVPSLPSPPPVQPSPPAIVEPQSQPAAQAPVAPVTTQPAEPQATASEDGVTVITPEIIEEKFYSLHDLYPDQTLEVTGTIDRLSIAEDYFSLIELKTVKAFMPASCPTKEQEIWARCAPGQTVTLRGQVERLDRFTQRVIWKVVNVQGSVPPVLTSVALAKEFTDHDSRASADYADQWFYLTGEIISTDRYICTLKSDGVTEVQVGLPEDSLVFPNPFLKSPEFQVGKTLTLLAKYDPLLHEPGAVNLDGFQITRPFPIPATQYATAIGSATERMSKREQAMLAAQADFTITSNPEFDAEIKADQSVASQKYDGKISEVKGTIESFRTEFGRIGDKLVLGLGENQLSINCVLATATPWKDYQKQQTVTVRGRFDISHFPPLTLHDAVIVKSEPHNKPRIAITTEELIQKVAAEGEFSFDAWKGQEFIVSGKIHEVTLDDIYSELKLDAGAAGKIHVHFWNDDHIKFIELAKRQPGEMIRVQGEVRGWSPEQKIIELDDAWALP